MNNNQFIVIQIIILIVFSIYIIDASGFLNGLNGVCTVSNFNLTSNGNDNYTVTYDLTPKRT